MVRKLLFLLMALPLLLPPGVCLCRGGHACAATEERETDLNHGAGRCCHDGHDPHEPGESACAPQATPEQAKHAPSGKPHEHVPGCPALRAAGALWVAKTGNLFSSPTVAAVALDPAPAAEESVRAIATPDAGPLDPPLYLTLRALRI